MVYLSMISKSSGTTSTSPNLSGRNERRLTNLNEGVVEATKTAMSSGSLTRGADDWT